jgi:hypothetical protein
MIEGDGRVYSDNLIKILSKTDNHYFNEIITSTKGIIIIDDELRVVDVNDIAKKIFFNDLNLGQDFFGNVFGCSWVNQNEELCGTGRACNNCKIRNSIQESMDRSTKIKNINISKAFYLNGSYITKWFDSTYIPIKYNERHYVAVFLDDKTEAIGDKIFVETKSLNLFDEEKSKFKDQIVSSILRCVSCEYDLPEYDLLILIDLCAVHFSNDYYNRILTNENISRFYRYLLDLVECEDLVRRHSRDKFLVLLKVKDMLKWHRILEELNNFNNLSPIKVEMKCHIIQLKKITNCRKVIINDHEKYYIAVINYMLQMKDEEVVGIVHLDNYLNSEGCYG